MKSRSQILLEKSLAAMAASLDVANKPMLPYKEEAFTILICNAYELLLKAKWLKDNGNKAQSLYIKQARKNKDGSTGKRESYKTGRSGNPLTHEPLFLLNKINEKDKGAYNSVKLNLEILIESRDSCIHFYSQDSTISRIIREIGLASVKNYANLVKKWFDIEPSELSNVLVPLGVLSSPIETISGNQEEEKFINYILKHSSQSDSDEYSVALKIDVKLTKSNIPGAIPIRQTKDGPSVRIEISEQDIKEKYPWEHNDLVSALNKRYSNFKQDGKFNSLKKELHKNQTYSYTRLLNPSKENSGKKIFYSQAILNEFDKSYTRK